MPGFPVLHYLPAQTHCFLWSRSLIYFYVCPVIAHFLLCNEIESLVSQKCVQLFVTRWTIDNKTLLSMKFSRQEYWSELSLPSPGDFPDPGIELCSPVFQADSTDWAIRKPLLCRRTIKMSTPTSKKKINKENIISSVSRMWENLKTMTIKD